MINKINLAKAFFKRHWYKFLSVLCALAVASVTSLSTFVFASSVTFADLLIDIASVSPVGAVVDYANLLLDVYRFFLEDSVIADREMQRTKILAAWKTITDNSTMTEDQFADYWQQCIDELGLADDRIIMIEDTVRLGLTLEDVINHCYHSDGDGVSVSDTGAVQITGQKFKQIVDYWSDYYNPKDNLSQYVYSYNDGNYNKSYNSHNFVPYCPVYTSSAGSSTGWGMKGWSGGVYILPFYDDDDLSYVYYGKYCFHIYTTRSADGTLTIFMDTICLTDGSIYNSCSSVWDSAYNTLAFTLTSKPFLYHYTSYFNYLSAATGSNGTWFLNVNSTVPGTMLSGTLSSPLTANLWDIKFSSSTFNPVNNIHDDWGYIVSSEPFSLWAYQSDIDTSKIPDDYTVTVTGDTVYDYSITNTSGDTTTINNYITNNYTVPVTGKPDSGGSSAIGDITVSGDIGVNGQVDINVNVNNSIPSYDEYVDSLPNKSDTLSDYLKVFFDFLPAELLSLILGGVATAIICSIFRR